MENKANRLITLAIFIFNIPGSTQLKLHNLMEESARNSDGELHDEEA